LAAAVVVAARASAAAAVVPASVVVVAAAVAAAADVGAKTKDLLGLAPYAQDDDGWPQGHPLSFV
jgi:hypothetical protein